jgi:predicted phosphodiesterase
MKIAVISDVHGNLDALVQVLNDIEKSGIQKVFCLGDNVGYGPEPEEVVQLIRKENIPCIMGNHERVIVDPGRIGWFNPVARESLKKTRKMLSEKSTSYICYLPPCMIYDTCRFVHGFPPDSVNTYLFQVSYDRLKQVFKEMDENICFVGHTHELEIIGFDGKVFEHIPIREACVKTLCKERQYIINIGSVGQPRDGNNNAKYVIWDTSDHTLEVKFVPYDIEAVVNKINNAGLPKVHGERLW